MGVPEGDAVSVERLDDDATAARETVVDIGKRSFPFLQSLLLHETPHVFAARHDDGIVGGTISEVLEPAPGRRVGLVTWIFTDADARGLGAGRRLLERTVAYLENLDCEEVVAIVRWQNTSSNKLFAAEGFVRTSTRDVLEAYGLAGTARLYWGAMYLGPGFELWTKGLVDEGGPLDRGDGASLEREDGAPTDREDAADGGAAPAAGASADAHGGPGRGQLLLALGVNVALFVLAAVSILGVDAVASDPLAAVAVPVGFLAARYLPARLAALAAGEAWTYRSWANAYPPAVLLAAAGLFVPVPGHLAPDRRRWTLDEELDRLGPAAVVSCALVVGLYAAALFHDALPVGVPGAVADLVVYPMAAFLFVDVLFVTFPFNTYNGTVVYRWNRAVWALLALVTVALLAVVLVGVVPGVAVPLP